MVVLLVDGQEENLKRMYKIKFYCIVETPEEVLPILAKSLQEVSIQGETNIRNNGSLTIGSGELDHFECTITDEPINVFDMIHEEKEVIPSFSSKQIAYIEYLTERFHPIGLVEFLKAKKRLEERPSDLEFVTNCLKSGKGKLAVVQAVRVGLDLSLMEAKCLVDVAVLLEEQ